MRLVADSGSTKTDWCLVNDQSILLRVSTSGMNPYLHTDESLDAIISKELLTSEINTAQIDKVEFYGAGCSEPAQTNRILNTLRKFFSAEISVDHDLLGAAKSVCKDQEGIAIILGTGSNSCHYDGEKIVRNVRSLGFVLGDEGSGCYIGKKLIQDYLNDELPNSVHQQLELDFDLSASIIFDKVYKQPLPNKYLASFATWVSENSSHSHLYAIIESSFIDFFKQHIIKYDKYQNLPIHVVGSVGFHNRKILEKVATTFKYKLGTVIKSPIEGLV
ncbi:MAG: N-acetylglucosamine kinase-like BadF-type ATPase [Parvicella sp.]|jgi:N-acetylglucosamine kinase-like BadF-type ATPase